MRTIFFSSRNLLGTVIMLALLLAAVATFAADELDEIGPAVDTSADVDADVDSSGPPKDDIGPAVDTSATVDEISRSTTGGRVMDSIELGRTEITGNQELPTVMYIVPWKKADPGDLMGKPVNTLLDEILAPIDREEFLRQVKYYDGLYGDKQE